MIVVAAPLPLANHAIYVPFESDLGDLTGPWEAHSAVQEGFGRSGLGTQFPAQFDGTAVHVGAAVNEQTQRARNTS